MLDAGLIERPEPVRAKRSLATAAVALLALGAVCLLAPGSPLQGFALAPVLDARVESQPLAHRGASAVMMTAPSSPEEVPRSTWAAMAVKETLKRGVINDYMTPQDEMLTLKPDMPLQEAAVLLNAKGITGAPVVDGDGKLVGVLSQFDFLFKEAGTKGVKLDSPTYREDVTKMLASNVASAMSKKPLTASPTSSMQSVAAMMIKNRFNHVPVVDDEGSLVGILRSTDIMLHVLECVENPEVCEIYD